MCIDCNIRHWNLIARKSIHATWSAPHLSSFPCEASRLRLDWVRRDTVPTMSMELGLTIEARDDREMPERILGCAQFHKPSWDAATKVE